MMVFQTCLSVNWYSNDPYTFNLCNGALDKFSICIKEIFSCPLEIITVMIHDNVHFEAHVQLKTVVKLANIYTKIIQHSPVVSRVSLCANFPKKTNTSQIIMEGTCSFLNWTFQINQLFLSQYVLCWGAIKISWGSLTWKRIKL